MVRGHDGNGAALDDPEVVVAAGVVMELPSPEQYRVLLELASAVLGYERSRNPAVLCEFARDFAATVRLRRDGGYEKLQADAPTSATGPGRSVQEIFASVRR